MVKFNTFFKEIVKILAKFIKRIFLQSKMWLKHDYFNFALESREGDFSQYWVRILPTFPDLVSPDSICIIIWVWTQCLSLQVDFKILGIVSLPLSPLPSWQTYWISHVFILCLCLQAEDTAVHWSSDKSVVSQLRLVWFMVFNNISVISWWSDSLVEETGVPGENHRPVASYWQTL